MMECYRQQVIMRDPSHSVESIHLTGYNYAVHSQWKRFFCVWSRATLYNMQWQTRGGRSRGGGGLTPYASFFACQFENSYGPAFSRTLPPLSRIPGSALDNRYPNARVHSGYTRPTCWGRLCGRNVSPGDPDTRVGV